MAATLKGKQGSSEIFQQLGRDLRALTPAELDRFKQVGAVATSTHKAGFKPFGERPSTRAGRVAASRADAENRAVFLKDKVLLGGNGPAAGDDRASASAMVPAESEADRQIMVRDPIQDLIKKLQGVKSQVSAAYSKANAARDEVVSAVSSFLGGSSCLGPPLVTTDVLGGAPGELHQLQDMPHMDASVVPVPNPLAWAEWLPPADAFTQAG